MARHLPLMAFLFVWNCLLQAQVCFYVADETDALHSYDINKEQDELICELPVEIHSVECLAYDPVHAVLYSVFEGRVLQINPRNCKIEELFQVPHSDVDAVEYYNDTLILATRALESPDSIVSYRLSTGNLLSGPFPIEGPGVPLNIDGLAYDPCDLSGERLLYATLNNEGNGDSLFTINPVTGIHKLIGPMSTSDIESISFTALCGLFAIKGKKPSSIWRVDPQTGQLSDPVTLSGGDVEGFACDPIYIFFKDGYLVRKSLTKSSYFDVLDVTLSGLSQHPGVEIEVERKFQDATSGKPLHSYSLTKHLSEVQFNDEVPDDFTDVTYCIILSSSADRPILAQMNVPLNNSGDDVVRIFPNPTSQVLQVQLNTNTPANLTYVIRDQVGKPIIHENLNPDQTIHSLDVSLLPFGYYSIEVIGTDRILLDRFFIAR